MLVWLQLGWVMFGEVRGGYGVSLWKYVRSGWVCFSGCVTYSVGSGVAVRFWLDWWRL